MIITANMVQIALCWGVVAFTVATVVLAIDKAKLDAEVKEAKEKLDYLESQLEGEIKPRSRRSVNVQEFEPNYRLPTTLQPINYDLYINPNTETGNFTGRVVITVLVLEETNRVTLHSHKLDILRVFVTGLNDEVLEVETYDLDTMLEFLHIQLKKILKIKEFIKVGIEFKGRMEGKIVGLYSSTYLGETGERRSIATTKFEPTYARQAFPCFDEPAMKATFDITLVHPKVGGYHALSNMNEERSENVGDHVEVKFAQSVPMSTYVSAFIVSDFAHDTKIVNTQGIGKNFNIRIFATAQQLSQVNFALDTAVAITEFYIQYFQVEYPLPKLDMVAVPDFVSNAMENWGLVTYRETALLYDKAYSSTWNKQRVAHVVAHELGHMWFGNLVTLMWWNDLWLNEGFARFLEYKGVNEVYPEWGMPDQFLIHALHSVLKFDATVASHPIIQTVTNPDQITEIFDSISYEKGASVIRMLENFIGAEVFEKAVTNYLNEFKYDNAVTDDFIGEIVKLEPECNVKLIMRTWTEQMGLPVVNVARISNTQYRLTQKRFFANIEDYDVVHSDSAFNYTWTIPITYRTNENQNSHLVWFDYNVSSINIDVPTTVKWIKLNAQQVGYYRVNYEETLWKELISNLVENPEIFSIADRAHLLNDIFALSDATQLAYDIALDMTTYLNKELDFVPWQVATGKLQALKTTLMFTDTYADYAKYAQTLISKAYNEVGWTVNEGDHLKNRLRVSILNAACAFGLPECLAEVATRFDKWLANPTIKPDPDLREIIYYFGMETIGNEHSWEKMWAVFVAEQDASEKSKLMYGLSAVRIPMLLYRFIGLAANEQLIRRQDYFNCLQNIAGNPVGTPIVWDYVREHWLQLVERFGLNERYLGRMIPAITDRFATETRLVEMQEFFNKYPEAGAGAAARQQALETVKYNIKWLQLNKNKVADWLRKHLINDLS